MGNENVIGCNWYVVYTHCKQEDRAQNNLSLLNIDILNPKTVKCHHNQYTGAPSYVIKSLYPRYIFARFILEDLIHKVRFTRGVHSLVSLGSSPTPVDETIIHTILARMDKSSMFIISDKFKPGDEVIIKEGLFKDLIGSFEREMDDSARIKVLLSTIDYQAHLVLDRQQVERTSM